MAGVDHVQLPIDYHLVVSWSSATGKKSKCQSKGSVQGTERDTAPGSFPSFPLPQSGLLNSPHILLTLTRFITQKPVLPRGHSEPCWYCRRRKEAWSISPG